MLDSEVTKATLALIQDRKKQIIAYRDIFATPPFA